MLKHTKRQINALCFLTCVLLPCLSPQFACFFFLYFIKSYNFGLFKKNALFSLYWQGKITTFVDRDISYFITLDNKLTKVVNWFAQLGGKYASLSVHPLSFFLV